MSGSGSYFCGFDSIQPVHLSFLQTTPHPSPSQISSACLAVDVLSPDVRTALVGRYVALELKDYKRVFRVASGASSPHHPSRILE